MKELNDHPIREKFRGIKRRVGLGQFRKYSAQAPVIYCGYTLPPDPGRSFEVGRQGSTKDAVE